MNKARKKEAKKEGRELLSVRTIIPVRFSEVDSMGLVWHGHFLKFFEDGREAFGQEYGLGYMDVYRQGYVIPVVDIDCEFKCPVRYEDSVTIEVALLEGNAAKIQYRYRIFRLSDGELAATGSSTQVFMDPENGELCLTVPDFYQKWKRLHGLLDEG